MDLSLLEQFARKYIWWKTPDEALHYPNRILSQVMNIGTWDDVQILIAHAGEDNLRDVLLHAEAGEFNPRSWTYWHYRLGLAETPEQLPPAPTRKCAQLA